jgi:hypothetical protein
VAEVLRLGPRREDQCVVGDRAVREQHLARRGIEARDLGEQHPGVLLSAQNPAVGRRDVGGREAAGGHLVEQRLEHVEVAAVEHGDLDRRLPQGPRDGQAAEPAAHDDYAMWM